MGIRRGEEKPLPKPEDGGFAKLVMQSYVKQLARDRRNHLMFSRRPYNWATDRP